MTDDSLHDAVSEEQMTSSSDELARAPVSDQAMPTATPETFTVHSLCAGIGLRLILNIIVLNPVFFVMERAGTAYRHLFQVMKNKNYYFEQCYTVIILEF